MPGAPGLRSVHLVKEGTNKILVRQNKPTGDARIGRLDGARDDVAAQAPRRLGSERQCGLNGRRGGLAMRWPVAYPGGARRSSCSSYPPRLLLTDAIPAHDCSGARPGGAATRLVPAAFASETLSWAGRILHGAAADAGTFRVSLSRHGFSPRRNELRSPSRWSSRRPPRPP